MNSFETTLQFEGLRSALQSLGSFSENEFTLLREHLSAHSLSKDDYLLKENQVCQAIYFVEGGSFRQYFISESGEECIQNLYTKGDWMLAYKSFTSQRPSAVLIQATEDSTIWALGVYDLHKLMKQSDRFFQLARIFQYAIEQQELQTQFATPIERYTHLLATKPALLQRFPLKYIASYLGMTPETLSRVRRRLCGSTI